MKTVSFSEEVQNLYIALKTIRNGGIVIAPSDTVYGVLCDATNAQAVEKLIAFKNRPAGKPISVFMHDLAMAKKYVEVTNDQESILKSLLPGPFTIILPSSGKVDKRLESETHTLGIRIPNFIAVRELVRLFGKPITATSANMAGSSPFHSFSALIHSLSQEKQNMVDIALDAGELTHNRPSTVIDLTQPDMPVLRVGDRTWKKEKIYITKSPEETENIGKLLFSLIQKNIAEKPVVIILQGQLGAGKTVLVKGVAKQFGIRNITSPTFIVDAEYKIPNPGQAHLLHHLDLYNIQSEEELDYLGFQKMLKQGNLVCIEWGEKAGKWESLLKDAYSIYIQSEYLSPNQRKITIKWL